MSHHSHNPTLFFGLSNPIGEKEIRHEETSSKIFRLFPKAFLFFVFVDFLFEKAFFLGEGTKLWVVWKGTGV